MKAIRVYDFSVAVRIVNWFAEGESEEEAGIRLQWRNSTLYRREGELPLQNGRERNMEILSLKSLNRSSSLNLCPASASASSSRSGARSLPLSLPFRFPEFFSIFFLIMQNTQFKEF